MEVTVKNENCASSIPPSDGCANTENDPFAYLERSSFTSEKFKIEIRGLPKFYGLNVSNWLTATRFYSENTNYTFFHPV